MPVFVCFQWWGTGTPQGAGAREAWTGQWSSDDSEWHWRTRHQIGSRQPYTHKPVCPLPGVAPLGWLSGIDRDDLQTTSKQNLKNIIRAYQGSICYIIQVFVSQPVNGTIIFLP
jgi:hypothetical protein